MLSKNIVQTLQIASSGPLQLTLDTLQCKTRLNKKCFCLSVNPFAIFIFSLERLYQAICFNLQDEQINIYSWSLFQHVFKLQMYHVFILQVRGKVYYYLYDKTSINESFKVNQGFHLINKKKINKHKMPYKIVNVFKAL